MVSLVSDNWYFTIIVRRIWTNERYDKIGVKCLKKLISYRTAVGFQSIQSKNIYDRAKLKQFSINSVILCECSWIILLPANWLLLCTSDT